VDVRTSCEVALVGAGPIGLELAVLLKREGIDFVHLEKGQVGETIGAFPRQMHFFSSTDRIALAGLPLVTVDQQKATREEYLAYLRQLVRTHDLQIRTHETVDRIERTDDGGFRLLTRAAVGARTLAARRVVLATGDMHAPRRLDIPGEDLPHVHHRFDEPHRYFGTRLLVIGGRNSAVEAALRCHHVGARVALSYRRPGFDPDSVKYWLLPELEGRIRREEIAAHLATVPVAISSTDVVLQPVGGGEPYAVAADFVLVQIGFLTDTTLLRQVGVTVQGPEGAPVHDPRTMETDVPGLFVAGTVTAGSQQRYTVFIENCHVHAERIAAALAGREPPEDRFAFLRPES